jgi:hypothetical protein
MTTGTCHLEEVQRIGARECLIRRGALLLMVVLVVMSMGGRCDVLAADGLRLRISSQGDSLFLGEPLVVKVCLVNEGKGTARAIPLFDLRYGLVDFTIWDDPGNVFAMKPKRLYVTSWYMGSQPWTEIPPQDSSYGYVTLLYCQMRKPGTNNLIMFEPGAYRVKASFALGTMSLESNELQVRVLQTPCDQVEARRAFLSKETLWFVGTEMTSRPRGAWDAYNDVVTCWPGSDYAGPALYYMARIDQLEKNFARATEEYDLFLSMYRGAPYSELAEIQRQETLVVGKAADRASLWGLPASYRRNAYLYYLLENLRLWSVPE